MKGCLIFSNHPFNGLNIIFTISKNESWILRKNFRYNYSLQRRTDLIGYIHVSTNTLIDLSKKHEFKKVYKNGERIDEN